MLVDLKLTGPPATTNADIIIVGAGAVGLAMAVHLARQGRDVLVLEAGAGSVNAESQAYFEAATASGHDLPGLQGGRFRALGGTTNGWGGQLVPFDGVVFKARPWVSASCWPISREDLDPYYEQVYALLGMSKVIRDDDAVWRRLGVAPKAAGGQVVPFFSRWTPETNFTRLFAADIQARPNLRVWTNAPVTALLGGMDGTMAGVQVAIPHAGCRTILGKRVILANGTIEIARLLMLPLADGTVAPWSTNPWLGRGFMDHLDCYAGTVKPIDQRGFSAMFDNAYLGGIKYQPKLKLAEATQREQHLLGIAAHFVFDTGQFANLKILLKGLPRGRIETAPGANPLQTLAALRFALPMLLRYLRHRRMFNRADCGIQLRLTAEHAPLETNRITLWSQKDSLGMPLIDVAWRFSTASIETAAVFAEYVRDYLAQTGLATVALDPRLVARDPAFLTQMDDANHHMGTARMSNDAATGVVDNNMRVFGADNLYVAGAAVYPTSGFANPTLTAIALGLRLADKILGER